MCAFVGPLHSPLLAILDTKVHCKTLCGDYTGQVFSRLDFVECLSRLRRITGREKGRAN